MKKSLIALSIMSVFGMQAYAQTTTVAPTTVVAPKDIPDTTSLNKKVVKEGERTQKDLSKDKISPAQAATLDKNESKIAKDLVDAKSDGKVTRDEKKYIKKEVDKNQDMRDDMKDVHKDAHKDAVKTKTNQVTDVVRPAEKPMAK